jgi:hypothetical protein
MTTNAIDPAPKTSPVTFDPVFDLLQDYARLWLDSLRLSADILALPLQRRFAPDLSVQVEYDPDAKVYWCHCKDIGLLTEAPTLDGLVEIARELGPDIATDYGYSISPDALTFVIH